MVEDRIVALVENLMRSGVDALTTLEEARNASEPDGDGTLDVSRLVRKLISKGNPRIAFDLARSVTANSSDDFELRYLSALACVRGGNLFGSEAIVSKLLSEPELSKAVRSDALSLKGRLIKDRVQLKSCEQKSSLAAESAACYEQAYNITHSRFPAINAATMWYIAGSRDKSREFASRVHDEINRQFAGRATNDYWESATFGESLLLMGDIPGATEAYRRAVELAGTRFGDIATMSKQLRMLEDHIPAVKALLPLFDVGRIIVFSGSMLEKTARAGNGAAAKIQWDLSLEQKIRDHIRSRLTEWKGRICYSSAACGCDLIFAEVALELGLELHIVLPFGIDDFYKTSVDFGLPELASWRARCDAVVKAASQVYYATREPYLGDDLLFEFANDVMQGLAVTRAAEFGSNAIALVVTDPSRDGERGGANHFLKNWAANGYESDVLDLADYCRIPNRQATHAEPSAMGSREIKSMLFADVKGFSKLREEQTMAFFLHFLKEVSASLKTAKVPPIFWNTWGDGLFLVFESAAACAELALDLCDRVTRFDFKSLGLPDDLMVRVGIHAGPVFRKMDAILLKENFFGSHVNRAARIEPVTMPGCVYASEQMAALLAISKDSPFRCEYVGKEHLYKGYDTCILFHVLKA